MSSEGGEGNQMSRPNVNLDKLGKQKKNQTVIRPSMGIEVKKTFNGEQTT